MTRSGESSSRVPLGWITLVLAIALASLAVISTGDGMFDRPICPNDPKTHPIQALGGWRLHASRPPGCQSHPLEARAPGH